MKCERTLLSIFGVLAILFLSVCGPSHAELAATATQVAAAIFATQTAEAPTTTSTPTATQTDTPIPTATNTSIPTETFTPTTTSTPTPETIAGPDRPKFLLVPSGYLLPAEWEGIPVLPEAIAGLEEYGGYYYSVEMPVTEVKQYYQQIMSMSGWSLFAIGVAEDGSLKLVFQKDSDQISITVFNIEFQPPESFVLIIP